jgi:hypothetical protein
MPSSASSSASSAAQVLAPAPRRFSWWAVACVALYALLALALVARVPLAQAPDEAAHWQYIEHIAARRALPVFEGAIPPAPGYEFHQPPLYYLLAAPAWAATDAGVQNYTARLVSLVCGAGAVWLVFAGASALFQAAPNGARIARRAGLLAAVWPVHVATGASSNNDALAALICAALFWRLALLSGRAPSLRDGAWIGALGGLGLLSKSTTLSVFVVVMAALWHLSRRAHASTQVLASSPAPQRNKKRAGEQVLAPTPVPAASAPDPGRVLGAALGTLLGVSGWMMARNTLMYGDPLAFRAFRDAAQGVGMGLAVWTSDLPGYPNGPASIYFRALALVHFATSWGFYGGVESARKIMKVFSVAPAWPSGWLLAATLVLLSASAWVLGRGFVLSLGVVRRLRAGGAEQRDWVWLWWGLAALAPVAAWGQFALGHFAGAQARYLLPALAPACVLAARAWEDLPPGARRTLSVLVFATFVALTLANVFGLAHVGLVGLGWLRGLKWVRWARRCVVEA